MQSTLDELCYRQHGTVCHELDMRGVEKGFEIDFSLNSAIENNFSGYVWKFVVLYLLVF